MRPGRRRPRPGDRFVVDCTTSDWRSQLDVEVTAGRVVPLGCGCTRVETTRPGPEDGPLAGAMHLLVERCAFHARNHAGYGPEPVRLEAPDETAMRERLGADR